MESAENAVEQHRATAALQRLDHRPRCRTPVLAHCGMGSAPAFDSSASAGALRGVLLHPIYHSVIFGKPFGFLGRLERRPHEAPHVQSGQKRAGRRGQRRRSSRRLRLDRALGDVQHVQLAHRGAAFDHEHSHKRFGREQLRPSSARHRGSFGRLHHRKRQPPRPSRVSSKRAFRRRRDSAVQLEQESHGTRLLGRSPRLALVAARQLDPAVEPGGGDRASVPKIVGRGLEDDAAADARARRDQRVEAARLAHRRSDDAIFVRRRAERFENQPRVRDTVHR